MFIQVKITRKFNLNVVFEVSVELVIDYYSSYTCIQSHVFIVLLIWEQLHFYRLCRLTEAWKKTFFVKCFKRTIELTFKRTIKSTKHGSTR